MVDPNRPYLTLPVRDRKLGFPFDETSKKFLTVASFSPIRPSFFPLCNTFPAVNLCVSSKRNIFSLQLSRFGIHFDTYLKLLFLLSSLSLSLFLCTPYLLLDPLLSTTLQTLSSLVVLVPSNSSFAPFFTVLCCPCHGPAVITPSLHSFHLAALAVATRSFREVP